MNAVPGIEEVNMFKADGEASLQRHHQDLPEDNDRVFYVQFQNVGKPRDGYVVIYRRQCDLNPNNAGTGVMMKHCQYCRCIVVWFAEFVPS